MIKKGKIKNTNKKLKKKNTSLIVGNVFTVGFIFFGVDEAFIISCISVFLTYLNQTFISPIRYEIQSDFLSIFFFSMKILRFLTFKFQLRKLSS